MIKDSQYFEGVTTASIVNSSRVIINQAESTFDIPKAYLRTQVALHLPQHPMATILQHEKVNKALIKEEGLKLGAYLEKKIDTLPVGLRKLSREQNKDSKIYRVENNLYEVELDGTRNKIKFGPVSPEIGSLIQHNLHYMGNVRSDTEYHFGLFRAKSKYPFAYVAYSRLDRNYILDSLPFSSEMEKIVVLTRAYNVNSSPYNAMSTLISLSMRQIVKDNPEADAIVTAINPNSLFRGTVFFASGFKPFALVPFVPKYYKGYYATRKTVEELSLSKKNIEKEITSSKFPLAPTIWVARLVNKKIAKKLIEDFPISLVSQKMYERG